MRLCFGLILALWSAPALAANVGDSGRFCAAQRSLPADPGRHDPGLRPDLLYGDLIGFEVRRNGDAVGRHETRFVMDNGVLRVTSETTLKVKVLFVTAYSFTYDATSTWCGGQMTAFRAHVNNNGKIRDIRATRDADGLLVEGPAGQFGVAGEVLPTEHWNAATLKGSRVFNTLNGKIANVEVTDHGEEQIEIKGGVIPARHYSYSGDLAADVWYDKAGRWVKLQFVTKKDKSVIEYICATCQSVNAPPGALLKTMDERASTKR